jgi:hypothetical protein
VFSAVFGYMTLSFLGQKKCPSSMVLPTNLVPILSFKLHPKSASALIIYPTIQREKQELPSAHLPSHSSGML